jgi:hypothetical protein
MSKYDVSGIDWAGPAVDIIDELVLIFLEANEAEWNAEGVDYDDRSVLAHGWAERLFERHAQ